ncbi:MAG: ferritin-like domain-containing protein [Pseudomonadota bacterium]
MRHAAASVLTLAEPDAKRRQARAVAAAWRSGALSGPGADPVRLPERPARPDRPEQVAPGKVRRRRLTHQAGRFALLHAVGHIEFNAIDLAFDMAARFGSDPRLPAARRKAFISDWLSVGDDEARHFQLVSERLKALGGAYGDLPAHDGLWAAAEATSDDMAARLAVAPMVLEARGLDVTPGMIDRLNSVGDADSAAVLAIIYREEIGHVAAGRRWFDVVCNSEGRNAQDHFQTLVRQRFKGLLKPPFNQAARASAGLPASFYEPLASR